ncbi:hypothetical protein [Rhodopseudomonas palustris]|uniref:hypothetical protein n=1 Tax=Rhodopseudomonas palustris TaxID=1076 RepID=UPI00059F40CC
MTENANRYAIHALEDRRATLAGEVLKMKEGIRYREERCGGQLNRLILDALRRTEGRPLSNQEIAAAIVETKGYGLRRCRRWQGGFEQT